MAKNNGGFLLGTLVGGIAGAAAAMFLTSEKGRQWLAEWSSSETWEPVKTTAAEWLETAKEKTKEIAEFIPLKTAEAPSEGEEAEPADRETLQKLFEEAEAALDDAEQTMGHRSGME